MKLEEQHLLDIKQLLREHESLFHIKAKLDTWKKEGYNIEELEKMVNEVY